MVSVRSRISLLIFCLDDIHVGDGGILKSPTTTVLESICSFKSFIVSLMKFGALTLGAYRLLFLFDVLPFLLV
jgi:hypothetical protein